MKLTKFIIFVSVVYFFSCKTKYSSKEFLLSDIPKTPDYSDLNSWAAHPKKLDSIIDKFYNTPKENLKADVFYIYPTLLTNKNNDSWNASVNDSSHNLTVRNIAIRFQASAWASAGKIYSPYYRQVHYRSFFEPHKSSGGMDAGVIAYDDIKKAFQFYLKNFNEGRPIIIVGHSQGAYHCISLLKEFFDGKELQNQLVAAYLPGSHINDDEFNTIYPLKTPEGVKGYLSWNTFRKNRKPRKNKHPAFYAWKKRQFVTNPISWDESKFGKIDDHKGLFFYDSKIYNKSVFIEIKEGIVWSSVPKGIKGNIYLKLIKNYHFGDINIFWKDISENVINRVNNFYNLPSENSKISLKNSNR